MKERVLFLIEVDVTYPGGDDLDLVSERENLHSILGGLLEWGIEAKSITGEPNPDDPTINIGNTTVVPLSPSNGG